MKSERRRFAARRQEEERDRMMRADHQRAIGIGVLCMIGIVIAAAVAVVLW